jgi:uncharacterized membrane protein
MSNPLQGGRGRPLHPALVHFPVALYPASLLFDWLSHLSADGTPYVKGAYALIVAALVVTVPVALTGVADFLTVEGGSRAWRLAFTHLTVMLAASGLFLASAVLRRRDPDVTSTPLGLVLLDAVAVALLAVGVVLGHDLVFRYGRRVEAAPGGQQQRAREVGSDLSRP